MRRRDIAKSGQQATMLTMRSLSLALIVLGIVGSSAVAAEASRPAGKPNFVFILIDDMGWTDVGCFGSTFYHTPNIDRLAQRGMRFTDAYAACTVCSPTRASILTGHYPARVNITDWIPGHKRPFAKLKVPDMFEALPASETTLAETLKAAGYVSASIGKWHLGGTGSLPTDHGFDLNIGGDHRGQPPSYFDPYNIPTLAPQKPGEYLTDRLTREAEKFIEAHRNQPFFLYLPHYGVHTPLQGKEKVVEKYKALAKPDQPQHNATYAAMVESIDDSVGRILAKLDELKIRDNTVVIFFSDNGGLMSSTSNVPLRAGKGSAYEGGVRVPLIIDYPGVTAPASVSHTPVISTDFYPTLLEMAGAADKAGHILDGVSLVPLLTQTGPLARDTIYWHYPHYHPGGATPYSALREGDNKLIEFFETGTVELYNLKDDISEKHDLAPSNPQLAARLRQKLQQWRQSVGARLPTPNPDYDPVKDRAKGKAKGKK